MRAMTSKRYIALLRGVNVGRAKRIAMADLRKLIADLGYGEVRSVLNSGNVVFSGPARPLSVLRITTSSLFTSRTRRSGCNFESVRCCSETRTRFIKLEYGRPASAAICALRIFDAATICRALVICEVFRIDLIRRRMSCVFAITYCQVDLNSSSAAFRSVSRS